MGIRLGRTNRLRVVKEVRFGLYLDGGDDGEILLPRRYVPQGLRPGDEVTVFIYLDDKERLVATTLSPRAQVGEVAAMKVMWTNRYGAFVDWGLMKDLFVPFREQEQWMMVGQRHVVYVHVDEESFRIVGSSRLERWLGKRQPTYKPGDEVKALVWRRTPLGWNCAVDNAFLGLVYADETYGRKLRPGTELTAYIKQVRPDGRLDLSVNRTGRGGVSDVAQRLLEHIRQQGGRTSLCDYTPAEKIYATLGVSKKQFKKAVGDLYSKRLISIEIDGLVMNQDGPSATQ